jgi:hypothetical protein
MTDAVQRRSRSSRARNRLWYATNGVCTRCGAPLPARGWHADHIVPWRVSHTTNQHEMQALCAGCNLSKGGKHVQFDSDFITALRPFQQRFLLACTTMPSRGKRRITQATSRSRRGR